MLAPSPHSAQQRLWLPVKESSAFFRYDLLLHYKCGNSLKFVIPVHKLIRFNKPALVLQNTMAQSIASNNFTEKEE